MEVSPLQAAMAGMSAHAVKMAVAANNIANLNTYSFKRSRAFIETDSLNLPRTYVTRFTEPGPQVPQPEGLRDGEQFKEMSNVDLAEEFVQMKLAEYGYKANASVIYAGDEMIGTILDIIV